MAPLSSLIARRYRETEKKKKGKKRENSPGKKRLVRYSRPSLFLSSRVKPKKEKKRKRGEGRGRKERVGSPPFTPTVVT